MLRCETPFTDAEEAITALRKAVVDAVEAGYPSQVAALYVVEDEFGEYWISDSLDDGTEVALQPPPTIH